MGGEIGSVLESKLFTLSTFKLGVTPGGSIRRPCHAAQGVGGKPWRVVQSQPLGAGPRPSQPEGVRMCLKFLLLPQEVTLSQHGSQPAERRGNIAGVAATTVRGWALLVRGR